MTMVRAVFAILTAMAAQAETSKVAVYASVGPELIHYQVDVDGASLVKRESVTLPDSVQYAWPHPSKRYIYVAWSNGSGADHHGVTAFRIDTNSGALYPHGDQVTLPARPIHLSTDIPGTHLLVAYNDPSGLTVNRLVADGRLGPQIELFAALRF